MAISVVFEGFSGRVSALGGQAAGTGGAGGLLAGQGGLQTTGEAGDFGHGAPLVLVAAAVAGDPTAAVGGGQGVSTGVDGADTGLISLDGGVLAVQGGGTAVSTDLSGVGLSGGEIVHGSFRE
jgi:hypothetical protein